MPLINDTDIYNYQEPVSPDDHVIGTQASTGDTKNFKVSDIVALASEGVNLNDVLGNGNESDIPIVITGETGQTEYLHNGSIFTDDEGNTVTIEQEAPVAQAVKLFVPALEYNDWFASRSTVSPSYKFLYPLNYTFRPCGIYYLNGKWHTDLLIKHIVEEKISQLKPYYVDGNNGSNSNNGLTEAAPFQTLAYAFSQGAKLVYILPGIHENIMGNLNNASYGSDDKFIIAKDPNNTFLLHNTSGLVFSAYEDIYSADISGSQGAKWTNAVVDFKYVNEFNLPFRLTKMSSLEDAETTPGSYYRDDVNFILYVHTLDGREPDEQIYNLTRYQSQAFRRASEEYVYIEGITFMGGTMGFQLSNNGHGLMVNNKYLYAEQNGFAVTTTGGFVWSDKCIAYDNGRDGFNYTQDSVTTQRMIETDCQGFLNGHQSDGYVGQVNLNGSSVHDHVTALRIGGKYWGNVGPNVIDVNGARSLNIGVECFQSDGFEIETPPFVGTFGDFVTGSNDTANPTYMWLYGCKSKDNVLSYFCPLITGNGADNSRLYVDKSLHIAPYGGNVVFGEFETGEAEKTELPPLSSYTAYDKYLTEWPETAYTQSLTWNGTAPSGTETKTWQATKVGKMVSVRINLAFTTPGSGNSALQIPLPSELPTPKSISGFSATNDIALSGSGYYMTATSTAPPACRTSLKKTGTGYSIRVEGTSAAAAAAIATVIYWTD